MKIIDACILGLIYVGRALACVAVVLVFVSSIQLPASATIINVDANSVTFDPAQVEVQPGDRIHFEIKKSPPHNVVFGSRGPSDLTKISHSEMVVSGGFDITIPQDTKPGTYQYWCSPHRGAGMVGEIVVKG
ncbi:MAG: plastocyanin/azurin family copper-binding protein [Cyanophyceae cyanobacterium]